MKIKMKFGKSLGKLLILFPFLFLSPNGNKKKIEVKEGIDTIYDLSYELGSSQISKLNENKSNLEDSWFFDGEFWYDVGKTSYRGKSTINLNYLARLIKNPGVKKLTHNHPSFWERKSFQYSPPSKTDIKNIKILSKYLGSGEIEVNDLRGRWNYYFEPKEISEKEKDSILERYKSFHNKFITREQNSNFNPKKEIKNLEDKARDLGIYLKYEKIR